MTRCKCGHLRANHWRNPRGKTLCSSAVCGCAQFRPHRPPAPELSPAERAVVDRFETAEPAPESWRPE
jgi:hypothetical protein